MNGTTPRKKTNITRTKPLPAENNNESCLLGYNHK